MRNRCLFLVMILSVILFIPACRFLTSNGSSVDSGTTTQTSYSGFTPEQLTDFTQQLNTQKDLRLAKSLEVPAYSFYRFDVTNLAGGQRLSTIVSYDQSASMTFGVADTAKVLLFDAMGRKAGYTFDYFAFIQSVPATKLDDLAKALVEQCADAEFIAKSSYPLASGPVVAAALEAALTGLPLPGKAEFTAQMLNRPSVTLTPVPSFPQLDSAVVMKLGLTEEIQNMYTIFIGKELSEMSFFKSSVPVKNIPRARIRSASSTVSADPPSPFSALFGRCVYDDTWWDYSDYNIGLYSAVGTLSAQLATGTAPTNYSVSSREDVDGRKVLVTYQGSPVYLPWWHGTLGILQIVLYSWDNQWSNGSCVGTTWVGSQGSGKSNSRRKMDYDVASFVYSEPLASTTMQSLRCEVLADGVVVASFVATSGIEVTQAVPLLPGKVATVAFYLAADLLSENEWNLLASRTIDRLYPLQLASVPDLIVYTDDSTSTREIKRLNRDTNSVDDWVKTFGNASQARTLLNLAEFRKMRTLLAERSVTIAGEIILPGSVTVSGISTGTFTTGQTFTVTGGTSGNTVQYSLDNGTTWATYTAAVSLSTDGTSVVVARQVSSDGLLGPSSAGITVTIDKTAPTPWSGYPVVQDIGITTFSVKLKTYEPVKAYVVAVAAGAAAPGKAQIKAGTDSAGSAAPNVSLSIASGAETAAAITGTKSEKSHDAYVVIEDAAGNMSDAYKVAAITTKPNMVYVGTMPSAWTSRSSFALVSFQSKLWTMFGETGATSVVNDIWNSSDGSAWTQQTIGTTPVRRAGMGYAVYDSKVWIAGGIPDGSPGYYYGNVCSFDGTTWTNDLVTTGFSARRRHSTVPFNPGAGEVLWLYGGYDGGYTASQYSANTAGSVWTSQAAPAWSAREQQAMTVFNSKVWLLGGVDASGKKNDFYSSSNGITWTAGVTPGNLARTGSALVSHNSRLYAFGGTGTSGALKDLWSTTDGTSWSEVANLPITARSEFGMVSFSGKLWIIGGKDGSGNYLNDIWTYSEP